MITMQSYCRRNSRQKSFNGFHGNFLAFASAFSGGNDVQILEDCLTTCLLEGALLVDKRHQSRAPAVTKVPMQSARGERAVDHERFLCASGKPERHACAHDVFPSSAFALATMITAGDSVRCHSGANWPSTARHCPCENMACAGSLRHVPRS
jgi:hypothetical protein